MHNYVELTGFLASFMLHVANAVGPHIMGSAGTVRMCFL